MEEITKDSRFSHIATDPRFRRIPKGERKVKIDKRFQSMFSDDKFKLKYTIDKRGRPVNHSTDEDLRKYYDLSSENESDSGENLNKSDNDASEKSDNETSGRYVRAPPEYTEQRDPSDKAIPDRIKKKLCDTKIDYARGEGVLVSDSSSDDESSTEESEDEGVEHDWGELDKDAGITDEVTYRLAACNMDWDRIRSVDLMVLFNSFLLPGGVIKSVTIYPSEFGLKRMEEEEVKGPLELVETKKEPIEEEEDNKHEETEEGSKYHMEKLRQYQLNRLKYYYAVIEFDNPETANKIYAECDGLEYESSATKLDLRFIPDDMVFDQEPKDVCDKLPELSKYQPRYFMTTALQQAKVQLTWDETNPDRADFTQKLNSGKIDEISDADLHNYLAMTSDDDSPSEDLKSNPVSEDEITTDDPIDKYRALLENIKQQEEEKKSREVEMEFTWGVNLKQKTENLVKKKLAEKSERTPFEQYLEKKKEKKKLKKVERLKKIKQDERESSEDDVSSEIDMNDPYFAEEFDNDEFKKKPKKVKNSGKEQPKDDEEDKRKKDELELLLMNEQNDTKKHFSLKKLEENVKESKSKRWKKKKKEIKTEDDFEIDVKDDRFSALYSSHHFNIDPADPHFKKTRGMEALIGEKLKRRIVDVEENGRSIKSKKNDQKVGNDINGSKRSAELSVLIKSVKRKTEEALVKKHA